jgi:hypothetical protein
MRSRRGDSFNFDSIVVGGEPALFQCALTARVPSTKYFCVEPLWDQFQCALIARNPSNWRQSLDPQKLAVVSMRSRRANLFNIAGVHARGTPPVSMRSRRANPSTPRSKMGKRPKICFNALPSRFSHQLSKLPSISRYGLCFNALSSRESVQLNVKGIH